MAVHGALRCSIANYLIGPQETSGRACKTGFGHGLGRPGTAPAGLGSISDFKSYSMGKPELIVASVSAKTVC